TIWNRTGSTQYLMAPFITGGTGTTDYAKNTRAFVTGTIDGAKESEATKTLTWGKSSDTATNTLTFNLGRNIQRREDALAIRDRIVSRITSPTYVLDDVR